MWKFKHTMLTSEVMNEAERMYQDLTITAEQRQEIEYAAYVACMNEDTTTARLADFTRVLKNHHVSPEDIAPAAEAHQKHTGGQLLTIYHRSTRPGVLIQASTFYRDRSGSWIASSHHDINTPDDIELHAGEYLTITKGA